ncbi:ubiquitin-conjugating enzyme E2 D4-like [Glandiceps talaboti]
MNFQKQLTGRLRKELAAVQKSQPCGINVYVPSDDITVWNADINGPDDSLYEGGKFTVRISFTGNYPYEAPTIHFLTPIYHLNVSQKTGQMCFGFLASDKWSPAGSVEQVLRAIYSTLIKPEEQNSFDHDVLNNYHHYRWDYDSMAQESAGKAK